MIAEVVSVGTELLLGQTVDTDAVYLAQMLSSLGITIYHRETVGDNPQRIKEVMLKALSRSDTVITIGGLGPTEDDLTKEMAAEVLGVGFIEDVKHALSSRLSSRLRGAASQTQTGRRSALCLRPMGKSWSACPDRRMN